MGREDVAGIEGDDRDLLLVDDGEDPPATERPEALAFNRTLTLKDTWARLQTHGRHDTT